MIFYVNDIIINGLICHKEKKLAFQKLKCNMFFTVSLISIAHVFNR